MGEARAGGYSRTFAFVTSSTYRQGILEALSDGPRRPRDLVQKVGASPSHVSRALAELSDVDLVERLPGSIPRAHLYGLTPDGVDLVGRIAQTKGVMGVIPLARGTHLHHHILRLRERYGEAVAEEVRRRAHIVEEVDPRLWYPLQTALDLLEAMEVTLGDGTYDTVRQAAADVVVRFASIRDVLTRFIPPETLAEMAPAVYNREFNHGRMEVEVDRGQRRARFYHFDWLSSPAKCASLQGTYEGVLRLRRLPGQVTKFQCRLEGDECCAYEATWG